MLHDFYMNNYGPERRDLILEVIEMLSRFNADDVLSEIEQLIVSENFDNFGKIQNADRLIMEEVNKILVMHGIITLDITNDLRILRDILRTLKYVSEDYDPKYILDRINFELDDSNEPVDVLGNLVALLTDSTWDDVVDNTFEVREDVVVNIKKLLDNKLVEEPPFEDEEQELIINRWKRFVSGKRSGLTYQLARMGIGFGVLDFNSLFLSTDNALYDLSREQVIFECVSLILISSAKQEDLDNLFDSAGRLMMETETQAKHLSSDMRKVYKASGGTI